MLALLVVLRSCEVAAMDLDTADVVGMAIVGVVIVAKATAAEVIVLFEAVARALGSSVDAENAYLDSALVIAV